jgi:Ser/Thr protein kinase RdoA (MazF antagonist)
LSKPIDDSLAATKMSETVAADVAKEPSDEEMRKLLKPTPSYEQILVALQGSYADPGQSIKFVKDLESYDDRNFWVEIAGAPYLAKVHNGVESKDFIELHKKGESAKSVIHLQNAIMDHLNKNGINTSKPVDPLLGKLPTPASIQSLPVASSDHSPCELVVRLLGWVEGTPMSSAKLLPLESLADAGRFLGRMGQKLSELDTSELVAAKRFHQWDGKNTMGVKDFVRYIEDPRRKALVESVLEAFQRDLIDSKASESFETSIIHGKLLVSLDYLCCPENSVYLILS